MRLPRLPGHGTRWQELNRTTWHDWYAEDERALLELRERCETVVVMGLSMGGTLALRLAEQHGDAVDGLVLVNPSVHTENAPPGASRCSSGRAVGAGDRQRRRNGRA